MISDIIKIDNIKDFDFKKNTVIEASAGTGKTYTITQIVPWLLAYAGLSLGQILMVTYTEKAAGEMRARIRKKLNEIAEKLQWWLPGTSWKPTPCTSPPPIWMRWIIPTS